MKNIESYDNRKDIPDKYKWDLSSVYKSIDDYYKDMEHCKNLVSEIETFKGSVLKSAEYLLKLLEKNLELDLIADKMNNYIFLNSELDTRDSFYDSKMKELMDFWSDVSIRTNFISDELKSLTNDTLDKFLNDCKELKKYEFSLRCTIKNNAHILSLESENLLSTLAPVLSAGEDIFLKLSDADSDYGFIEDSKGEKHKLTDGTFSTYITSPDRVLRKNADEAMHEYYKKRANTFAACLFNHVKTNAITSTLRHFNSTLEASLLEDDISKEFYDNFIKSVNDNLNTLHRMMDIYKRAFNLDEMHIYDAGCKYDIGTDNKYTIDEMKEILIEALAPLGKEYVDAAKKGLEENWVDYYETPGKRSGAFSTTTTAVKPYLLLNYTGSFDDLETFAHELGHSMHTYFANANRGPEDANYPIFLAEIASTTNELLLNNYLLNNTKDDNFKKFILNNLISMYKATIFRQTEFAEFERIIYDRIENGANLSREDFTDIYYNLQKKYYGPNVVQDDYIRYECFRVPHFYYNFYVYKYATSLAIAYHFAYGILSGDEKVRANYLKFLKSGGKDYPLNILKECGIDIKGENLLDYSIEMITKYMDQFEELISRKEE